MIRKEGRRGMISKEDKEGNVLDREGGGGGKMN
jgi:hypothetical protein